jgi:hypothetical protein
MVNFLQRRRRDVAFNKAMEVQAKEPRSNISENLVLVSITVFAIHYIFQIQYLEILWTFIAVAAAMNKWRDIWKWEWYEWWFFEWFEKWCE